MAAISATTLAIAAAVSIAAAAASTAMSIQSNKESAEANMKAQAEQARLNAVEARRQQMEINKQAHDDKSDVIRKAEADLGTLRAVSGGMGASASSFTRLLMDISGSEGRDITRVERNRQAHIDALQADAEAGRAASVNNIRSIRDDANNKRTQAYVGLASTVLTRGVSVYENISTKSGAYGATGQGLTIRDSKSGMLGGGV